MLYFFRVCQNCSDKGHFGSAMDKRIERMGHMEVGLMVVIFQIEMILLEMEGCCILQIGEVMDIGTIIVLVLINIMIIIIIILTGGVLGALSRKF